MFPSHNLEEGSERECLRMFLNDRQETTRSADVDLVVEDPQRIYLRVRGVTVMISR